MENIYHPVNMLGINDAVFGQTPDKYLDHLNCALSEGSNTNGVASALSYVILQPARSLLVMYY